MEEKKVTWLELFFDLVFVTAVSFITHILVNADHNPDFLGLYFGEFLLMVFPLFWLWVTETMFLNRFSENLPHLIIFILPQMFCLIFMTASMNFGFRHIYHNFLVGYLCFRLLTIIQYYIVSRQKLSISKQRTVKLQIRFFAVTLIITAASVLFAGKWRYFIIYTGIVLDILLPLFYHKTLAQTPVNLPHLTERFGAFVIIAFGESLVSVTNILSDSLDDARSLIFAALTFILISSMWVSYFYDFENTLDRKQSTNGQLLLYGHFFILMAIMILAACLHLLYAAVLPQHILMDVLFGAAAMFFIAKHLIFFHYRRRDSKYNLVRMSAIFILMVVLYVLDFTLQPPIWLSIFLLSLCFIVEIMTRLDVLKILRPARNNLH